MYPSAWNSVRVQNCFPERPLQLLTGHLARRPLYTGGRYGYACKSAWSSVVIARYRSASAVFFFYWNYSNKIWLVAKKKKRKKSDSYFKRYKKLRSNCVNCQTNLPVCNAGDPHDVGEIWFETLKKKFPKFFFFFLISFSRFNLKFLFTIGKYWRITVLIFMINLVHISIVLEKYKSRYIFKWF